MHRFTRQYFTQWRPSYDRKYPRIHSNQPELNAVLKLLLRDLNEHFKRGVLHVKHATSVHPDDPRSRFSNKGLNLMRKMCSIREEDRALRPQ